MNTNPLPPITLALALVSLLAPLGGTARADTVTLTPSADTSISSGFPNNNLGASGPNDNALASGGVARGGDRFRMLVKFDFSGMIPPGATINSVKLTLRVRKLPPGGVASRFELHRMLKPWTEGRGTGPTGSAAAAGEPTWRNQAHPSTPWSAPGAAAPGDFVAEVSAAQTMNTIGKYDFNSTPTLVADVQQWVNDPATNFGWILISAAENTARTARRIDSRESGANAPTLVVEFTPPTVLTPPQITQGLQNQTVAVGANVIWSVTATGSEPLTYQWKRGDTVLAETGPTLTLNNVQLADSGLYTVTVSNAGGAQSSSATLTVIAPAVPPRIEAAGILGGKFAFNFDAEPTRSYAVQARVDLHLGDWDTIETFPATPQARSVTFTDPLPPTAPRRFYRVVVRP